MPSITFSPKARRNLESILREFERCAAHYPPLFHQRLIPWSEAGETRISRSQWESFMDAHAGSLDDLGWYEWDGPKSIRGFERAIQLSQRKGMQYQHARSLLDLAAVQESGRDENRRTAVELLKKMESVIPHAERWLLGDQYDDAVVAPEFDLEAWEREHGDVTATDSSDSAEPAHS